ncbi:Bud-site selection protein [Butyriboletus roseoflavus]|nr:Bud-site selection protein [Butyriboletus roseoflavus]
MTKLKKDKTLSADPSIQAISVELASNLVSPGAPGTPTAKVQSRILSSKVLASEVVSMVETLRTFLHPSVGSEDIEEATDNPHASPNISKRRRTGTGHKKDEITSKDNTANPSGEGSDGRYENTSDDEAISEVDDRWESGTVDAPSGTDGSVTGSADGHASETPKSRKSRPHGSKGQSEFLPSLSVGFARGDSGSECSDSETRLVDGMKKNRRGQRARRAIWEKKFGRNANHIKKRQQTVRGSKPHLPGSVRIDRRSGKGNSSSRSRAPPHAHEQVSRPTLEGSEGVKILGATKVQFRLKGDLRENQGKWPLHPSWEAKRKLQAASIVPSQGTKIVFSES